LNNSKKMINRVKRNKKIRKDLEADHIKNEDLKIKLRNKRNSNGYYQI